MLDTSRQWAKDLSSIRPDHVKRYELASRYVKWRTLDAACGCGYGSSILYKACQSVVGIDASQSAIEWAERYFPGPGYIHGRIENKPWAGRFGTVVTLETLEHLEAPEESLKAFRQACYETLVASVPNEELYPFKAENFAADDYPHIRHYRPAEFEELLESAGFVVKEWYCQKDKNGDIHKGTDGMFLIAVCE